MRFFIHLMPVRGIGVVTGHGSTAQLQLENAVLPPRWRSSVVLAGDFD
jgi:hypothetical protein